MSTFICFIIFFKWPVIIKCISMYFILIEMEKSIKKYCSCHTHSYKHIHLGNVNLKWHWKLYQTSPLYSLPFHWCMQSLLQAFLSLNLYRCVVSTKTCSTFRCFTLFFRRNYTPKSLKSYSTCVIIIHKTDFICWKGKKTAQTFLLLSKLKLTCLSTLKLNHKLCTLELPRENNSV